MSYTQSYILPNVIFNDYTRCCVVICVITVQWISKHHNFVFLYKFQTYNLNFFSPQIDLHVQPLSENGFKTLLSLQFIDIFKHDTFIVLLQIHRE